MAHSPFVSCIRAVQTAAAAAWATKVAVSGIAGLREKAMTKVSKYSANGMTHRKGAEATSTDR